MAAALQRELEAVASDGITAAELSRVQKATRRQALGAAQSNSSMASLLAAYHARTGSWRGVLEELDVVQGMKPDDVRGTAQRTFERDNCFRGFALA